MTTCDHVWLSDPPREVLIIGERRVWDSPSFPAYFCSLCGAQGFDASPAAIARLEKLWGNRK